MLQHITGILVATLVTSQSALVSIHRPLALSPFSRPVLSQVKAQGVQRNDERIDVDGLPHVGAVIYPGQAYYSKVDRATGGLRTQLLDSPTLLWTPRQSSRP